MVSCGKSGSPRAADASGGDAARDLQLPAADDVSGADWFAPLAEALSEAVAVLRHGRIVLANQAMLQLAGRSSVAEFGDAAFGALFKDTGRGLPGAGGGGSLECGLYRSDGDVRSVIARLAWSDPETGTEIWTIDDPTRLRMLESEVLALSRALHARNREVADLEERLQSERADREEMLGVVSHELRTPVTIISGYNRLLLSEEVGPLTEDQRRFLFESTKGCRRLYAFIEAMLEGASAHASGGVLEVARVSMREVVESVADLLRPLLDEHELTLRIDVAENADWARIDRMRIEQVLTNLIENAIAHSPAGATIEAVTRSEPPSDPEARPLLGVSVCDEGPGVPLPDRERIFDAYVQAGGRRRSGSVGLGLAVCKRIVEAHGGAIAVTDSRRGGSCFRFTVPAADAPGAA